jgi:ATP-binding cassette subfamily B protein
VTLLRQLTPLWPYLKRYRRSYGLGFAALVGNNAVWVTMPLVIKAAVDSLSQAPDRATILRFALLLVGVALAKGFFQYWTRYILIGISRDIEYDLRNDLFRHLTTLPLRYYQRTRTGDIMARATNDLNAVRMLLGPGIMYTANTLLVLALAAAIMVRLDWRMSALALLPVPLVSFSVFYFGRQIHDRFEKIQALFSELSAKAQENISGMRIVKAYVQAPAEIEQFRRLNLDYLERNRSLIRIWGVFYPLLDALIGLTFVLVLWAGGREVLLGRMTLGSYVAFNAYLVQLTWPMIALGWVVNLAQRGTASLGRLAEVFRQPAEIAEPDAPANVDDLRGEIEFRNLTFSYHDDGARPALRGVNLRIRAGETVAIVGRTGSGKSTLVHLIPRLFEAPPGTVFVDGVDIRRLPLALLRRGVGFVPQETFLFSATISENILLGVQAAPSGGQAAARRAAHTAGLHADIAEFPAQYQTRVGERGVTLSGGQRQRTAIARALARDPRILILDDALSSVDTHTEELILTRLQEELKRRTAILISHRVSTVQNADRIIVLDGGQIVEEGRHAELLARGGYYASLHQKQLLEEELETI